MNIKELKITNSRGDSIGFGRHFHLIEDFDISGLKSNVFLTNTTSDGAYFQGTKLDTRDFDLLFYIKRDGQEAWWIEEKRHEMNKVCNPKLNPIRFDFTTESGKSYYFNAQVTTAPNFIKGRENDNKKWLRGVIQFIANDPLIYEAEESKTDIALWIKNLTFPVSFGEPIAFGYRSPSLIVNVENRGSETTGMIITFKATNEVVNPKLLNVNTYEELKLNFIMQPLDEIEISTFKGKRYVRLKRNNIVSSIFGSVDLQSTFLQLHIGDNLFRYDANDGLDYLEVSMKHTNTLIGV